MIGLVENPCPARENSWIRKKFGLPEIIMTDEKNEAVEDSETSETEEEVEEKTDEE